MTTNPSFDPSLFNSGVSQAQWVEWTSNRKRAADQQGRRRAVCAGLDLQDGGRHGRARGAHDHARRPHLLPRLPRHRRHAVPLLEQVRPRRARRPRRAEAQLRRVLLRGRPPRPASTASPPWPTGFGIGVDLEIELPGARKGLMPTRELAHRPGQALEHRRHDQLRHRPGLHPDDPARALHLRVARRDRPRGAAAPDPHARRRAAARASSPPTGRRSACPSGTCTCCARACGRWSTRPAAPRRAPGCRSPGVQLAGKTGSTQVRRVSREARERGLQVGEPALGVPAARAVRLLRAL